VRMGSRKVSMADDVAAGANASTNGSASLVADASTGEDCEGSADDKPASMGAASLRVLVQALIQQGKTQYLVIRNSLQRPEYFGRALTREEKQTISDILQDTMNQKENRASQEYVMRSSGSSSNMHRQNSRARQYHKSKSTGAQISRGFSRCNSNGPGSDRPPLARASSRELRSQKSIANRLSLNERPTGHIDRLSLTERLSTGDRLSLTMERLSLSKQFSNMSSVGSDFGEDSDLGAEERGEPDEYSLFADEPMRVSDCLAPVACP